MQKLLYAGYGTCFFIIVFALASTNILLGAIIGMAIGYLLGYLHDLNAEILNLQQYLKKEQPIEQQPQIAASKPLTTTNNMSHSTVSVTVQPAIAKDNVIAEPPLWLEEIWQKVIDYFTTGNIVVKIGIIILLFGIGFLLQYAASNGWLPLPVRLATAATFSILLFLIGYRLRQRRRDYGLALQGGAIGIIYLLVYISCTFYHLLGPAAAFILTCLISISAIAFALLQNALTLATLALFGGFLAPYFVASTELNPILYFSYYTLINLAVLVLAWSKSWRALNMLGFWFTFLAGALWGYYRYNANYLIITETFLSIYFLIYIAISLINVYRQPIHLRNPIDATLIFGTPFLYFSFQKMLLISTHHGMAICTAVLTLFYAVLAYCLFKLREQFSFLLAEIFSYLALIFFTLFIPYTFNVHFTITSWALEACLLIWHGIKQTRPLVQLFGILMLCITSLLLIQQAMYSQANNFISFNLLFIALASFISSYLLVEFYKQTNGKTHEIYTVIGICFFSWALLAWTLAGKFFINEHLAQYNLISYLSYFSISSLIAWHLQTRTDWAWLRLPAFSVLGIIPIILIYLIFTTLNPLGNLAWLGWLLAFLSLYYILYQHENSPANYLLNLHTVTTLFLVLFLMLESHYFIKHVVLLNSDYQSIGVLLPPIILLLSSFGLQKLSAWPVNRDNITYPIYSNGILAAISIYLLLVINISQAGNLIPLHYIPLFNILDLTILLGVGALTYWLQYLRRIESSIQHYDQFLSIVLIFEYFTWFNCMLARSLHHWLAIPYHFITLYNSIIAQAAYSIWWSMLALACILFAKYKQSRMLWLTGAWLIGIVVVKLFSIDLAHSGTLERIMSFVIVGVIMLLIGYFSPIPPKVNVSKNQTSMIVS